MTLKIRTLRYSSGITVHLSRFQRGVDFLRSDFGSFFTHLCTFSTIQVVCFSSHYMFLTPKVVWKSFTSILVHFYATENCVKFVHFLVVPNTDSSHSHCMENVMLCEENIYYSTLKVKTHFFLFVMWVTAAISSYSYVK